MGARVNGGGMSLAGYSLRPWTEVVRPHEDIVAGRLEMSTYAADLGAVDRGEQGTPTVYRDAREFFRTTYPSRSLRRLLADVLGVLSGGPGDRVIQLRTPFGGGKTHALLALYHLVKSRALISPADLDGLPDPGPGGRVAVLSGLDSDPRAPRRVQGLEILTLWGELAFRLGGLEGYELVRAQDEAQAAPGADVLRVVIGRQPALILLDEVLVYVAKAGGGSGTDPLRRQVMVFLQTLTEVVRGLPNAALVYSLQASEGEAAGDEALLSDLDHLVTRIDAKREPVSADEVLRVVQRRLFPSFGSEPHHDEAAREVARAHALAYRRVREAIAETEAERRAAGVEAERLESRILEAYPFHPALLDLMFHRWGSLPSYQRTRGALQFLAQVVRALGREGSAPQALIGPGDVDLGDEGVRGAFFSQVGERERYWSVVDADVAGDGARARDVDRRLGSESPRLERLRIGTRAATTVMLYSFGAREGEERGAIEGDLVQALLGPEVDRNVIVTALHDLRDELLYLHYTGRRYRFEPRANLNLLIAEEAKKLEAEDVLARLRHELERLLGAHAERVVLWPSGPSAVADRDPWFRVVYIGPPASGQPDQDDEAFVERLLVDRGTGRREYRNGLAFALPSRVGVERARSSARALMAIEVVQGDVKRSIIKLEKEQLEQLEERRRGAAAEFAGAVDRLYETVLVPTPDRTSDKPFAFDSVNLSSLVSGGRDLNARVLDALRKHVFDSLTAARLAGLAQLGSGRLYVACDELVKWFYSYFDFPKLRDTSALRVAIARGTAETFGYVTGGRIDHGELVVGRPDLVRWGVEAQVDEIDLGSTSFLLAPSLADQLRPPPERRSGEDLARTTPGDRPPAPEPVIQAEVSADRHQFRMSVVVTADQLFRILPAVQNLADRADRGFEAALSVRVDASEPFAGSWLRNAVLEHLDEAGVAAETDVT